MLRIILFILSSAFFFLDGFALGNLVFKHAGEGIYAVLTLFTVMGSILLIAGLNAPTKAEMLAEEAKWKEMIKNN